MPNAIIYSIPGSGTRFTAKFLEDCLGLELTSPESLLFDVVRNSYATLHVGEHLKKAVMIYGSDLKVIIPLRSPSLQYLSRRKSGGYAPDVRDKSIWQWSTLINTLHYFRDRHVFLPIDTGDRKAALLSVIDLVGATFDRSELNRYAQKWPIIGHNENPPAGHYVSNETVGYLDFAEEWYKKIIGEHNGRHG